MISLLISETKPAKSALDKKIHNQKLQIDLLDHLVRPCQHARRNREADLLCRLEVYHHLKLRWLLDRQVSGFGSVQYFVYIICDAPVAVREVRPVVHEPTGIYSISAGV